MWLIVELLAALYLVSFVWFLSLCRTAARRDSSAPPAPEAPSNLIPFERALELHLRKNA